MKTELKCESGRRKQIRIFKTVTGWNADFIGDSEIFNLFGSTVLPLPFTAQASGAVVLADVVKRNPVADVCMEVR